MPPESWSGNEFSTSSRPTSAEHLAGSREPLRLGDALDLEPEGDVVDHAAVREQAEVLEDHRDVVAAQLAQLAWLGALSRPGPRS